MLPIRNVPCNCFDTNCGIFVFFCLYSKLHSSLARKFRNMYENDESRDMEIMECFLSLFFIIAATTMFMFTSPQRLEMKCDAHTAIRGITYVTKAFNSTLHTHFLSCNRRSYTCTVLSHRKEREEGGAKALCYVFEKAFCKRMPDEELRGCTLADFF